jgi:nucleoredoxin
LHEGSMTHFDDEALEKKKLFLFFFSALWSAPGRRFTPQLIEYYNRVVQEHPEFEVVFFSADRSQFGMETYMTQSSMPWPAVAYDKLASKKPATKLVHGLPCLMLVDASGNVLFNSYGGAKDLGAGKALAEADKILAGGQSGGVVRGH